MFKSIRWRLWISYALVIFVALSIVALAIFVFLARDNPQSALLINSTLNAVIERQAPALLRQRNYEEWVQRIDEASNVRILIFSLDGEMLADSRESTEAAFDYYPSIGTPQTRVPILSVKDLAGKTWKVGYRLVEGKLWLLGAVARQPLRDILRSNALEDLLIPLLRAGVIALVLALIFAYGISSWITRPLLKLSDAVEEVAAGKQAQVTLTGPEELQDFGRAFNQMSKKLASSQRSQRDFVANVSHELKTPLTSIQGFSQAILDGTIKDTPQLSRAAEVIHNESNRMRSMVQELLELARLEGGMDSLHLSGVQLAELINHISEKLKWKVDTAGLQFIQDVGQLPEIKADADRLAQVFSNLLDNAIKHTPPGGSVQIKAQQHSDRVVVSVIDTGEGIPPEEIGRIFERFYQVDKARSHDDSEGAGLGLAIAEQIVKAHKGTIRVESKLGEGTVFTVELPIR